MLLGAFFLLHGGVLLSADTLSELREKIEERSRAIAELEKEITGYQDELSKTAKEAQSLQSAIRKINLEQKKLVADITLTQSRISAATLAIDELVAGISTNEDKITRSMGAIAHTLRTVNRLESATLFEAMLSNARLSILWDDINALKRFDSEVRRALTEVREVKTDLETQKAKTEKKRGELAALKNELSDRRKILAGSKREKDRLLGATKSTEANYRKIIAERFALRNSFEQELLQFESQLRFEIDPSALPKTGTGILAWPLSAVAITQYFGNTEFARAGGYKGRGHNGIDLRAPIGTRVRAVLGGTVVGVGDTDTVCPGASYGKWVLIEHGNGLSTLYAHLSLLRVSHGQAVNTGESIGYSGETGYATGPHLHLTVYATQGVRVMQRKSAVCRGAYTMPVADLKAYLNPLSYL
ncbi:MAG: peptidase M23 [Parcubacteria group bacterium Greene0416_79]|nr:MAG: peptidase M23 [Parcubacteria group bacterium Greene0416_79]